ncbi:phage tail assembly protein [Sporomusa sphaeroides DSM 2875]|uniref:phage tail assembly protein n=1 Tax=Sporomusa sphaeroides TaxID=47679 RepID=UPI00202E189A|nr:phage tail assembly protein [Sporomusa sphaeroides]MCM0759610.1 phage tail assembly protein [Sporomusa sphaeroides DSM 2875]
MKNQENTAEIIIPFRKPFTFEGKEYTEIRLDLDALSGKDVIDAEAEARAMGIRAIMLESSKAYQAILAAKAAGVTIDMIQALPAKEFSSVTGSVQGFLLE